MKTKAIFLLLGILIALTSFNSFAAEPTRTEVRQLPHLKVENDAAVEKELEGKYKKISTAGKYGVLAVLSIVTGGYVWSFSEGAYSNAGSTRYKVAGALIGLAGALTFGSMAYISREKNDDARKPEAGCPSSETGSDEAKVKGQ